MTEQSVLLLCYMVSRKRQYAKQTISSLMTRANEYAPQLCNHLLARIDMIGNYRNDFIGRIMSKERFRTRCQDFRYVN